MSTAKSTDFSEKLRTFRTERGMTQDAAAKLFGVSADYISLLERGKKTPSPSLARLVDIYGQSPLHGPKDSKLETIRKETPDLPKSPTALREDSPLFPLPQARMIPLVSWAQAGIAASFEQLPEDWQQWIPSTAKDSKAFAIEIRGDSMEPKYHEGDIAILLPSSSPRNGDLVVANIKDEGFALKILTLVGGDPLHLKLTSYNPAYLPMEFTREQFHWIYPVHSVTKLIRR